ncbi:hypothetical protein [Dongia sp.]|uniref:hypothetical protein n=1 Tax=Dongia sp. TaxID=1977262 RepID=UPI0035B28959
MKWTLIAVAGLAVLAGIGYGIWTKLAIDTAQPEFVASYKKSFATSCVDGAVKTVTENGKTVDDTLKAKITEVCACGAETSVGEFKEGMSFADMMALKDNPAFRQKVNEIMVSCRQKIGGF